MKIILCVCVSWVSESQYAMCNACLRNNFDFVDFLGLSHGVANTYNKYNIRETVRLVRTFKKIIRKLRKTSNCIKGQ